jgi:hypothetical protein
MLDGEKVLYMQSNMRNGVTQEFWYSLNYLVPIKYHEENLEEGYLELTDWHVVMTKEETIADDMFDIPEDMETTVSEEDYYGENLSDVRSKLLYKIDSIYVDEINFLDMTQILYYSKETHINLTAYFSFLLKDTADYTIDITNEKSIIEGTLDGNQVIVIVNNYMETENNDVNGISLNFYE